MVVQVAEVDSCYGEASVKSQSCGNLMTSEATASGVNVRAPMEMATGNLSDASIAGVSVGKQPLAIFHILSIDYQGSCESPLE
jgi:hypothetical protein